MKKRKEIRKKTAAALGLAVMLAAAGMSGCSGKDESGSEQAKTESREEAGDSAAASGEADSAGGAEQKETVSLPEYVPVDPDSVPESAEEDFIFESYDTYVTITGYQGAGGQVRIPKNLGGAEAIAISKDAFIDNETITYLYIPETVSKIDANSFRRCKALEEVYIGSDFLTSIDNSTFHSCESLRRVEIAGQVNVIEGGLDAGAFQECTSLTEVVFSDAFQGRIATDAFRGCTALETLDLSNTQAGSIGQCAFADCSSLKTVKIPASLGGLESNAFLNCPSLAEFEIAEGNGVLEEDGGIVYTIDGSGSYSSNTAMFGLAGALGADVEIREGTEWIASNAFEYIQTIETVKIPDSVKEIDRLAFAGCLELKSVSFGNGLETIGQSAFNGCSSLEEAALPDSLQELGSSAFAFCGLKRVSLPDNVKYYKGETTEDYMFCGNTNAVFTYQGKEYTYEQAAELDAFLAQ